MSQEEIEDFLEANRGIKYTIKELAEIVNKSPGSVGSNCNKLYRWKKIEKEPIGEKKLGNYFWIPNNDDGEN